MVVLALNENVVPLNLYPVSGRLYRFFVLLILFVVHDLRCIGSGTPSVEHDSVASDRGESSFAACIVEPNDALESYVSLFWSLFLMMDLPLIGFWIVQIALRYCRSC